MLTRIDKYILRNFLGTFYYSIALIILIVIVFDTSEKVDDFIQKEAPLNKIVFEYYLNFIPYFVNLFSALFTFIAVIFFTSRLASRTEIIAILSSGVSFNRLLRPYMIGASVIAGLSILLNHFVIPHANQRRLDFEEKYVRNRFVNTDVNIHKQIAPGTFIYIERYDSFWNVGHKFSLEKMDEGHLQYKIMAEAIEWDSTRQVWRMRNYYKRIFKNNQEVILSGALTDSVFSFTPKEFGRKLNNIETMNYMELKDYIKQERIKGSDNVEFYEVENYKRTAFPFSTFILTIIGVSLASRKVRGGIGMHIGLGLLISFSFILFMQISTTFATGGVIPPLIAVWIPNLVYGVLAWLLLKTAQK